MFLSLSSREIQKKERERRPLELLAPGCERRVRPLELQTQSCERGLGCSSCKARLLELRTRVRPLESRVGGLRRAKNRARRAMRFVRARQNARRVLSYLLVLFKFCIILASCTLPQRSRDAEAGTR